MTIILAVLFLASFTALGARPYRRASELKVETEQAEPVFRDFASAESDSPATQVTGAGGSGTVVFATGVGARAISICKAILPSRNLSAERVGFIPSFVLDSVAQLKSAPIPTCFVCNGPLNKKTYPDRDWYCPHCERFVSVR